MSILILYETKTGFTEECARNLHKELPGSLLHDIHDEEINLADYDTIIIGAPIYLSEIEHFTKRYFVRYKKILMEKKLGVFCAGMNKEEFNLAVQESLPPDIFYHANVVHCGGRIQYNELSLKDKFTVRRKLGIKHDEEFINTGKMDEFLKWILEK